MPKIELAIKDAIQRGARKQIRLVAAPVRREVRRLRQAVQQLRRDASGCAEHPICLGCDRPGEHRWASYIARALQALLQREGLGCIQGQITYAFSRRPRRVIAEIEHHEGGLEG